MKSKIIWNLINWVWEIHNQSDTNHLKTSGWGREPEAKYKTKNRPNQKPKKAKNNKINLTCPVEHWQLTSMRSSLRVLQEHPLTLHKSSTWHWIGCGRHTSRITPSQITHFTLCICTFSLKISKFNIIFFMIIQKHKLVLSTVFPWLVSTLK